MCPMRPMHPRTRRAGTSRGDDGLFRGLGFFSVLGRSLGISVRVRMSGHARAVQMTAIRCRVRPCLGVSYGYSYCRREEEEVKGLGVPFTTFVFSFSIHPMRHVAHASAASVGPMVPKTNISNTSKLSKPSKPRDHHHRCAPGGRATTTTTRATLSCPQTLTLFSLPDTADANLVSEVVDSAWSLQYMVRGPVCGSAGSIETSLLPSPAAQDRERLLAAFNNAVLFRYANRETLEGFLSHAKTKLMLDEMSSDAQKSTHGIASLIFSVEVPNELEAIFRRGDEWENGVELFMGLGAETTADEDVLEFFSLVNQLATSSAYGALQSGIGRMDALTFHSLHDETDNKAAVVDLLQCQFVYSVRFADQSQLEALLQSPPMQAILNGDDRSPVKLHWGVVQRIVSPEENDKVGKASVV